MLDFRGVFGSPWTPPPAFRKFHMTKPSEERISHGFSSPLTTPSSHSPNNSQSMFPSEITWDLTHGPLRKLLELLDTQVFSGSVQWVLLEISWNVCFFPKPRVLPLEKMLFNSWVFLPFFPKKVRKKTIFCLESSKGTVKRKKILHQLRYIKPCKILEYLPNINRRDCTTFRLFYFPRCHRHRVTCFTIFSFAEMWRGTT